MLFFTLLLITSNHSWLLFQNYIVPRSYSVPIILPLSGISVLKFYTTHRHCHSLCKPHCKDGPGYWHLDRLASQWGADPRETSGHFKKTWAREPAECWTSEQSCERWRYGSTHSVSSPDHTLWKGKGLRTLERFLGCADSAVMWPDPYTTLFLAKDSFSSPDTRWEISN